MTDMKDANFPVDADNRTYHLYLRRGEAANRVITVGDLSRALRFARLPGFVPMFVRQAPRLFTTITGTYKSVPVTLLVSLMGMANMDFTVRELRYVVSGPMAVIRVGSCGSPAHFTRVGDIACPSLHHTVLRVPDAWQSANLAEKFMISKPISVCTQLQEKLRVEAYKRCEKVHDGHNISACSFYSSQGRIDANFDDKNAGFIDYIVEQIPEIVSIEMESAHLMDLARIATVPIYGACAQIILAQRRSQDFLTNDQKHAAEDYIGAAALEAIVAFDIPDAQEQPGAVWKDFNGTVQGAAHLLADGADE